MQTFQLHHRDQSLLFAGDYRNFKDCLEDAARNRIDLRGVNLAHTDLSEINLDGIDLSGASFEQANLSGANLSEAQLLDCVFNGAALFNACLCYSVLDGSTFPAAAFGGTDVAGASLQRCVFAGSSVLGLDFSADVSLTGSLYATAWKLCPMSQAPVVVNGLSIPCVIFDEDVFIGTSLYHCAHSIWRCENPGHGAAEPLPHNLFKLIKTLRDLRYSNSLNGCIALQKSTER